MTSKVVSGILLKAGDGQEPIPVPVTDHVSISEYVGGHFDAVTENYKASEFLLETDDEFTAVGYCHDEGLIIGLPLNKLATMVFRRELRGDVVVVSGTSPTGEYDGDNYDVPVWFSNEIFSGALTLAVDAVNLRAQFVTEALRRCVSEGLMDPEMIDAIEEMMNLGVGGSLDSEEITLVNEVLDVASKYHLARLLGMPAVSEEKLGLIDKMTDMMYDGWEVTDEAIAKFLEENGGN